VDIAAQLRQARARAGLSLRELAERAGTSHSTLVAYEQGRVTPNVDTAERILGAAGFEIEARLVPHIDESERERQIRDVLLLAGAFPARHAPTLQFPRFPGSR
jgi:transcriptional regulator with XRE-family HTH domain